MDIRMKRKVITIFVLLLTVMLITAGIIYGVPVYKEYKIQKAEEERLSQPAYFTEFHLSYGQLSAMVRCFGVEVTPATWWLIYTDNLEQWPDFSDYEMGEATERTEKVAVVLTYNLFVDPETEGDKKAAELAAEYGFSADNPITAKWIREHPVEAVSILAETDYPGFYYDRNDSYVDERYDEIMEMQ